MKLSNLLPNLEEGKPPKKELDVLSLEIETKHFQQYFRGCN